MSMDRIPFLQRHSRPPIILHLHKHLTTRIWIYSRKFYSIQSNTGWFMSFWVSPSHHLTLFLHLPSVFLSSAPSQTPTLTIKYSCWVDYQSSIIHEQKLVQFLWVLHSCNFESLVFAHNSSVRSFTILFVKILNNYGGITHPWLRSTLLFSHSHLFTFNIFPLIKTSAIQNQKNTKPRT